MPSTFAEFDLSTVRVGRHGGDNDDDRMFRGQLYVRIGAITVAAGQAETAMKRLLLLLRQERKPAFSLVDEAWTELERKLRRESKKGFDWRREGLCGVLDWATEMEIKRRRDDAVHSFWWDYSGIGVQRSRFKRKADGVTILSSFDELDGDGRLILEYAGRLDGLLGVEWPIAMLPDPTGGYPVAPPAGEEAP